VFENDNLLAATDEGQKLVSFYSLKDVLDSTSQIFPEALHQHRNFKKVTDLKRVSFSGTEGLLIADKTGEIGFINIKNVPNLP